MVWNLLQTVLLIIIYVVSYNKRHTFVVVVNENAVCNSLKFSKLHLSALGNKSKCDLDM